MIRQAAGAISVSLGEHAREGAGPGGNSSGKGPEGELVGWLPALYPEWLGDRGFLHAHGVRFPYVAGGMANGIATPRLVVAMARAGMLGFFGAAGLSFDAVEAGLDEIIRTIGGELPWGASLIHSPHEPMLEERVADLFIRRGVPAVEASAFLALTPSIVRYACTGLHVGAGGSIERRYRVFAKLSRPEVARRFMMPAPAEILRALVASGKLSAEEAHLAARVPLATDVTVEADSGWSHRQPAPDGTPAHDPQAARRMRSRTRVARDDPRRGSRWVGHSLLGGRGLRAGRSLRAHRLDQPERPRVRASRTTASACSPKRASRTWAWRPLPTCSSWA